MGAHTGSSDVVRPASRWRRRGRLAVAIALGVVLAATVGAALGSPGDLDPGFGSAGSVLYPSGIGPVSSAAALLHRADGTLTYAGATSAGSGHTNFLVARVRADGTPDPAWNGGAPLSVAYGTGIDAEAQSIVNDGGRTLVAGSAMMSDGSANLVVARYTAAGAPDTTFNGTGSVLLLPIVGATSLGARGLAVDSTGRVLVAGWTSGAAGHHREFIARFSSSGVLDAAGFNPGGTVPGVAAQQLHSSQDARAFALAVDGSDRPVISGLLQNAATTSTDMFVARFTTAGVPDTGFGTAGGAIATPLGDGANAEADALVLAGGKPTVAGSALDHGIRSLALARYLPDGSALDTTFHATGSELEKIGTEDASLAGLAVAADGALVATGTVHQAAGSVQATRVLTARFGAAGGLDPAFGTDGTAITPYGNTAAGNAIAVQADGKLVVAGQTASQALVARYATAEPPPPTTTTTTSPVPTTETTTTSTPGGPTADFAVPARVAPSSPYRFTGAPSTGDGLRYEWDVDGDGLTDTQLSANPSVSVSFPAPGRYPVTLRVTDSTGRTALKTATINVSAGFDLSHATFPENVSVGRRFAVRLRSGSAPDVFYTFRFGDHTAPKVTKLGPNLALHHIFASKLPQFVHAYRKAGSYSVMFTAHKLDGESQSVYATITAGPAGTPRAIVRQSGVGLAKTPPIWITVPTPVTATLPGLFVLSGGFDKNLQTPSPGAQPGASAVPISITGLDNAPNVNPGEGAAINTAGAHARTHAVRSAAPPVAHAADNFYLKGGQATWDFGDGSSKVTPAAGGNNAFHTYKTAGTPTLTVTYVPTGTNAKSPTLVSTIPISVLAPICKPFTVARDLPARPEFSGHCVMPTGEPDTYKPQDGDGFGNGESDGGIIVDGIDLIGISTLNIKTGGATSVHGVQARTVGPNPVTFADIPAGTFQIPVGSGRRQFDALTGKQPNDPKLQFNNLKVQDATTTLDPGGASAVLDLILPNPFHGTAPKTINGTTDAYFSRRSASIRGVADRCGLTGNPNSLSIPDIDLGVVAATGIQLGKCDSGELEGGGKLVILGDTLDATFKRPSFGGPSGFAISPNGNFDFGGANFTAGSGQDIPLGPVGLHQLGVGIIVDPFYFRGTFTLDFPTDNTLIQVTGCVQIQHVKKNEIVAYCLPQTLPDDPSYDPKYPQVDEGPGTAGHAILQSAFITETLAHGYSDHYFLAPYGETSVFFQGGLTLIGIPLADAYFRLLTPDDSSNPGSATFGGRVHYDLGNAGVLILDAEFEGIIGYNPAFFQFYGQLKGCLLNFCLGFQALVNNHYLAGCADLGIGSAGAAWSFDHSSADVFGGLGSGCNLKASKYYYGAPGTRAVARADLRAAPVALLPTSTDQTVRLPTPGTSSATLAQTPSAMITVQGAGDAPKVELITPDGRHIMATADGRVANATLDDQPSSTKTGIGTWRIGTSAGPASFYLRGSQVAPQQEARSTAVNSTAISFTGPSRGHGLLAAPVRGVYTIHALPGSVPITSVRVGLAEPQDIIRGSVKRVGGGQETLSYFVTKPPAGRTVVLTEKTGNCGPPTTDSRLPAMPKICAGVSHVLGTIRGPSSVAPTVSGSHVTAGQQKLTVSLPATGKITFTPQFGDGGTRSIVANITQDGVPEAPVTLTTFTATPPPPLLPPGAVHRTVKGSTVMWTWLPAPNATSYHVHISGTDGRDIEQTLPASASKVSGIQQGGVTALRTVTLTGYSPTTTYTMTVNTIDGSGRTSPGRTDKLAATRTPSTLVVLAEDTAATATR